MVRYLPSRLENLPTEITGCSIKSYIQVYQERLKFEILIHLLFYHYLLAGCWPCIKFLGTAKLKS